MIHPALMIFLWAAGSILLMGLLEYAAHRWLMHSRSWARLFGCAALRERHGDLHHGRYYGRSFVRCEDPAATHIAMAGDLAWSLAAAVPLAGGLACLSIAWASMFLVTVAAHTAVWSAFHREMHEPKGRWFARTRYFRFVEGYHSLHHRHQTANYGFLLPMDWLFGTYRRID